MTTNDQDPVECVGSLLIHTSDVQELSEVSTSSSSSPGANIQKRMTAAGTLIVPSDSLASPSCSTKNKGGSPNASPSIVRRVTERLNGPAAPRDETDWTED